MPDSPPSAVCPQPLPEMIHSDTHTDGSTVSNVLKTDRRLQQQAGCFRPVDATGEAGCVVILFRTFLTD